MKAIIVKTRYPNSPEVGTVLRPNMSTRKFAPSNNYSQSISFNEYKEVKDFFIEQAYHYRILKQDGDKITEVMRLPHKVIFKTGDEVSHTYNTNRGVTKKWVLSHFKIDGDTLTCYSDKGEHLFGLGGLVNMKGYKK